MTRKDFLFLPTFSTLNFMKKLALKRGLMSDGGAPLGVRIGEGEGEVSDEG